MSSPSSVRRVTNTPHYSSAAANDDGDTPDYTGKTLYQRTFYRLSPGAQVSLPNALVLEERLRFRSDPTKTGYMLPHGPRTMILREGTADDELTPELHRFDLGGDTVHNGPGTMDTTIATALYLAANPQLVQGDVLQVACEDGAAGLLACVAARFAAHPGPPSLVGGTTLGSSDQEDIPATVFPPRLHSLTLSDEGGESALSQAYQVSKPFAKTKMVQLKDLRWSTRIPNRRYDHYYRLVLGNDIDFNYPNSKELARTIANYLLPSNEFAVSQLKDGINQSSGGGGGGGGNFGGLGMDLDSPAAASVQVDPANQVDTAVPSSFVHVCPDVRETTTYLRQFLEKGFKMTVQSDFFRLERLQFVVQTLPDGTPEEELEELDTLELQDETNRSYQALRAVHSPDYGGEGTGEYFFPLETGEYESGSRNTYLEPEEGGSPW